MLCPNCGSNISSDSKFCALCGTPAPSQNQLDPTPQAEVINEPTPVTTATTKTKKPKKKLPLIITAVVLVVAIIAGVAALAITGTPEVKVINAFKNTVFNSSEMNIKVKIASEDTDYCRNDHTEYDISITIGDDIDSSTFKIKGSGEYEYNNNYYYDGYYDSSNYENWEKYSWEDNYSIKNGKLYEEDDEYGEVSEYLGYFEEDLEYYDIDVDLEEEINSILNGKIDEKAIEKIYNEIVVPTVEKMFKEELDETIELPEYDEIFGTATDLFKDKAVREALDFEKIKSDLPGTTYEYSIDLGDLAEAVLEYAIEDEQYKEYLEMAADEWDCDVDEVVDEIIDEFNDTENIDGTITVKSNRITNLTIDDYYGCTIEIEIESKK